MQFDNVKTEVVDYLCESGGSRISHIQRHGPQFHHESVLLFAEWWTKSSAGVFQVCLFTELKSDRHVLEAVPWSVDSTLQGVSARVVEGFGVDVGPPQDTEFANP